MRVSLFTRREGDQKPSSGEKLLSLALPFLGVLDVLVTTIVFLRQGELLSERNPVLRAIAGSHNLVLYFAWSTLYILFLAFLSNWLVSESIRARAGNETTFGKLLKKGVHDPKQVGQYNPLHFYVVLYSCLVGLYVMIIATNFFVVRGDPPTSLDTLVIYVMSLFSTASVAYFLAKAR
jgi:hypothetical protein